MYFAKILDSIKINLKPYNITENYMNQNTLIYIMSSETLSETLKRITS